MFTLPLSLNLDSQLGQRVSFLQHIISVAVVQSVVTLPGYEAGVVYNLYFSKCCMDYRVFLMMISSSFVFFVCLLFVVSGWRLTTEMFYVSHVIILCKVNHALHVSLLIHRLCRHIKHMEKTTILGLTLVGSYVLSESWPGYMQTNLISDAKFQYSSCTPCWFLCLGRGRWPL